jgi:PIN domain nuclease of toxin-antitoxin system
VLVWWYADAPDLPSRYAQLLDDAEDRGEPVAVSAITLWEIAKRAERKPHDLPLGAPVDEFLLAVERNPRIEIVPLSAAVCLESTRLGPTFHRDPADQLIVATARIAGLRLLTVDREIWRSGVVEPVSYAGAPAVSR